MSTIEQRLSHQFADATWIVQITFATRIDLPEWILEKIEDTLDAQDVTVARRAHEPGVVLTGEALGSEISELQAAIWEALPEHAEVLRMVDSRVVSPEVYEAEALRSDTPELLAATDVAALLGISRQRVHQLHTDKAEFPAPYVELGSGPVWTRPSIEHFNRVWTRKPGRPAKHAS
jgi:predicted DNA-binding transcriptional regulator AlpA